MAKRTNEEYRMESYTLGFELVKRMDDEQLMEWISSMRRSGVNMDEGMKALNYCKSLTIKEAKDIDASGKKLEDMFNLAPEMMRRRVNIILCSDNAKIPLYATSHSAGADLYSANEEGIAIGIGERKLIPTGIKMELPQDAEVQVRPRSGLSLKQGLVAIFGTIDSDYQGEIGIILHNISVQSKVIYKGERLAQLVFNGRGGLFQAVFNQVTEFRRSSERGEGGFGHTGVK